MSRNILTEDKIHPAIRQQIGGGYPNTVNEVLEASQQHLVLVVGMAQNPVVKKVHHRLTQAGIPYHYLEYGNYFKEWRRRTAIKMLTGWQTFPQVFVRGQFVGGFSEVKALLDSGELKQLLSGGAATGDYSI